MFGFDLSNASSIFVVDGDCVLAEIKHSRVCNADDLIDRIFSVLSFYAEDDPDFLQRVHFTLKED